MFLNTHLFISEFIKNHPTMLSVLKDFIIPFIAVFFGALFAHHYNLKRDDNIQKKQTYKQIVYSVMMIFSLNNELEDIKKYVTKYPKSIIKVDRIDYFELLMHMRSLYKYNALFPYIFERINQNYKILVSLIFKHNNIVKKYHETNMFIRFIFKSKLNFENNIKEICYMVDKIIVWLLILQEKLVICDDKYINPSLFIMHKTNETIPNINDEKYKFEKFFINDFDKYWEPNTLCQKFFYRIKNNIKELKSYIFKKRKTSR